MEMAVPNALIGAAGEHYVLYCLHRRGLLASLSPPGSPTVDILILSPEEKVAANLQVKTRTRGRDRGWMMGMKNEKSVGPRYFYALVDLEPAHPVTYSVPGDTVADVLREAHKALA
jgi:hypothetical protein